jgi:hypothetical protein
VVSQACNPSYLGGRNHEAHSSRSARAKSSRNPSQPMTRHSVAGLASQLCRETKIESWSSPPMYKARPYLKIINRERSGSMVQMVELLPSKYKALSSTSRTTNNNNNIGM